MKQTLDNVGTTLGE